MAEAAPFLNGNAIAQANVVDGQPDMGQADAAADRRLERRLHFYAVVYMMLGASSVLRAVVPHAGAHATSRRSSAFEAVIGISLWAAAVSLVFLSFHLRRFPMAALVAARLAQAALRAPFF